MSTNCTIRVAGALLALFLAPAAVAQEPLHIHGAEVDVSETQPRNSESGAAPLDFRRNTPILQTAVRRNLRIDSSDRYRHSVAMFKSGQKLDYFPPSEERRVPLSTSDPELAGGSSRFNWPFTVFFLALALVLWRMGTPRVPERLRQARAQPGPGRLRVASSTASGQHRL